MFGGQGIQSLPSPGARVRVLRNDASAFTLIGGGLIFSDGRDLNAMQLADVNGDGLGDLVMLHPNRSEAIAYLGNGLLGFAAAGQVMATGITNSTRLLVADLDGNTRSDLILADSASANLHIIWREIDGTHSAQSLPVLAATSSIRLLTDTATGRPGLVQLAGGNLRLFSQTTARSFSHSDVTPALTSATLLQTTDFDLDGLTDIVLSDAASQLEVRFGDGRSALLSGIGAASKLLVSDIDNDGDPDLLLLRNPANALEILRNHGEPWQRVTTKLTSRIVQGASTGGLAPTLNADVNGDGRNDLIGWNAATAEVVMHPGLSGGGFGLPQKFNVSGTTLPLKLAAADFDRDGFADVAVTTSSGVRILFGGATLGSRNELAATVGEANDVAFADLDGNGTVELLVAVGFELRIFTSATSSSGHNLTHNAQGIAVQGRKVVVFGGGTYSTISGNTVTASGTTGVAGVLSGRLLGNGRSQLALFRVQGSGLLVELLNDNAATFAVTTLIGNPEHLVLTDRDGDGHDDLVFFSGTTGGTRMTTILTPSLANSRAASATGDVTANPTSNFVLSGPAIQLGSVDLSSGAVTKANGTNLANPSQPASSGATSAIQTRLLPGLSLSSVTSLGSSLKGTVGSILFTLTSGQATEFAR